MLYFIILEINKSNFFLLISLVIDIFLFLSKVMENNEDKEKIKVKFYF